MKLLTHQLIRNKQTGFTLVELVVTMVVLGIMVLGITGFIQLGAKGYTDTVARQDLQNQARFVIEKMTREIRHAVPNSFSVTDDGNCVSFYPIRYVGSYIVLPVSGGDPFYFVVVSAEPETSKLDNLSLVINPSEQSELLTSSSNSMTLTNVSKVIDSTGSETSIYQTDTESDFDANNITNSVADRLYIYKEKVQYCISGTAITRQEDNQDPIQVAQDLDSGQFNDGSSGDSDALSRSNLVHMEFSFQKDGERTDYYDDVQVLNVP